MLRTLYSVGSDAGEYFGRNVGSVPVLRRMKGAGPFRAGWSFTIHRRRESCFGAEGSYHSAAFRAALTGAKKMLWWSNQAADTLRTGDSLMRLPMFNSKFSGLILLGFVQLLVPSLNAQEPSAVQEPTNGGGEEKKNPVAENSARGVVNSENASERVAYWITQLSHDHYLRRERASYQLKELGPVVIPSLISAMNDGDLEVTERSVAVISEFAISYAPSEDGNAWETLQNMAAKSVGRRALAAQAAMEEVSEARSERAEDLLLAAGVFIGDGEFSVAASQKLLKLVEVGDRWNGDVKVLEWLEWVDDVEHIRVTGKAIRGSVLRNVVRMPALKAIAIADSEVAIDDEVFASMSEMERIESLDIRYVKVTERQGDIISRLPLRASLTLMGTGIKSDTVDKIRGRLAGLEIQFRQGGFLGVSCYADEQVCTVNVVYPNTAAFEAGLLFRDVIVGAGDDKISSFSTLQKAINKHSAGDEVEIRFLRGGKLLKAKVRLKRLKEN